jgi:hypothetical protein
MTNTFDPTIGVATRWKRGQPSPNPGGRPRTRALSDALRSKLAEVKADDPERRSYAEVLASHLVELACTQSRHAVAAISEIVDRTEGKPRQGIEFSDVTSELRSKSDGELQFYIDHGRWPEDDLETPVGGDNGTA